MATTAERGYGSKHQRLRKRWEPRVRRGDVACWRCGELIDPAGDWDLGHDDDDRRIYRGPEHVACNRNTQGRAAAPAPPVTRTSRDW